MTDAVIAAGVPPANQQDLTKRDFLTLLTGSVVAIGAGALAWPFVDSMNPARDVLALSSVDADLSPIAEGQGITIVWRGKPIFLRHRTAAEIKEAQDTPMSALKDPQTDADRVKKGHEQWLIAIGICTHLGCVPLGNKPTDPRGQFGGWFCPCHGSQYDTAARIRLGPAPRNLAVPPYAFTTDTKVKIG